MKGETRTNDNRYSYEFVLLLALIAVVVALACILVFVTGANKIFISDKAWELTTQFLFVAVIGGGVGLAYRRWEGRRAEEKERMDRDRERRALRRASLEAFYRSCMEVHNGCKKVRRLLRASTIEDESKRSAEDNEPERSIERATYEKLMDQLEDYQLKAESLCRDVEAKKELFEAEQADISKNLKAIENYLRKVLRDYEDECTQRGNSKRVVLKNELAGFVRRRKGDITKPLTTELVKPTDVVRRLVVKLIEKNTPSGPEQ